MKESKVYAEYNDAHKLLDKYGIPRKVQWETGHRMLTLQARIEKLIEMKKSVKGE